jgi:hypothetical protein
MKNKSAFALGGILLWTVSASASTYTVLYEDTNPAIYFAIDGGTPVACLSGPNLCGTETIDENPGALFVSSQPTFPVNSTSMAIPV